jgi:hypothetical protein
MATTKTNETLGLLQLITLVVGFAGMGIALGRSAQSIDGNHENNEKNAEAISELSTITRDLAGTAIRTEAELQALARRVERLEND